MVGRVLHDMYQLTRLVGEGGMGAVYEATHTRLAKKRFAVKVLLPAVMESPEVFARFRREAEIATEIGHPHIVQVIDFNQTEDGLPYLVMELLEGEDLGHRLRREGRLPLPVVAQIIEQAGSALQAAHDHEVVHRDMKPDNIFLLATRLTAVHVKVLDFGISKVRHSSGSLITRDNQVLGTPSFMSPEQAEGLVHDVDHTTDIFALGCIAYYALSGELPFIAPTIPGVLYKVCHATPIPLRTLLPELHPSVERVVNRALAKKKADRYQRVEDLARELVDALGRRGETTLPAELAQFAALAIKPPTGPQLALALAWAPSSPVERPGTGAVLPTLADSTIVAGLAALPDSTSVAGLAAIPGPGSSTVAPAMAPAAASTTPDPPAGSRTTLSGAASEFAVNVRPHRRLGIPLGLAAISALCLVGWLVIRTGDKPANPSRVSSPRGADLGLSARGHAADAASVGSDTTAPATAPAVVAGGATRTPRGGPRKEDRGRKPVAQGTARRDASAATVDTRPAAKKAEAKKAEGKKAEGKKAGPLIEDLDEGGKSGKKPEKGHGPRIDKL